MYYCRVMIGGVRRARAVGAWMEGRNERHSRSDSEAKEVG
jgi:hypothetical protein